MQTQQTRRVGRRERSTSGDQVPDQIRDSNIELITIILEALEKEHEYLCVLLSACLIPLQPSLLILSVLSRFVFVQQTCQRVLLRFVSTI